MSIEACILLKGDCICIPPELIERTPADLLGTHQGNEKMKSQVREAGYWPDIDTDIASYV